MSIAGAILTRDVRSGNGPQRALASIAARPAFNPADHGNTALCVPRPFAPIQVTSDAIRRAIPPELKEFRALCAMEGESRSGSKDGPCPCCVDVPGKSPGWWDIETLERCPLCCGFQWVPLRLRSWWRDRMDELRCCDAIRALHQ